MNNYDPPWHVIIHADEIPETGRQVELIADESVRARVAKAAGVLSIPRLEAEFGLSRKGDGIGISGRVTATVEQTCVVTLEPIANEVNEAIDITAVPEARLATKGREVSPEAGAEADYEPMVAGGVDLGAIATEFLILGIDPYPRKEGAVFAGPSGPAQQSGPFDVLAKLKGKSA